MSDELLRCPNGCHEIPGDGVVVIRRTFEWVDGATGENNYCRECGAELVPAESDTNGENE